jgi:hypothetical protein
MPSKQASELSHTRPDFTVKTDKKAFDSAQAKVPGVQKEIQELEAKLVDKRKELAALNGVNRPIEPGFSNAAPASDQLADNKATQVENQKTSTVTKNTKK